MTQRWILAAFPVLAATVVAPSAVASLLAFSTPARAEPMRLAQAVEYGGLPPYEIVTIVRSAGLDPLDRPVRRGPNYELHAIGQDDQEVRVIVDARRGQIVRVVPTMTASRAPAGAARGGYTMGPYERMDGTARPAPGYAAPGNSRYGARSVDPDDDEDDPSYQTAPRPPANVPGSAPRPGYAPQPRTGYADPPPVIRATPPAGGSAISRGNDLPPPSGANAPQPYAPRAATAYPPAPRSTDVPPSSDPRVANVPPPEPGRDGMLPPPPERFPQRVAPAAEKAKNPPKPAVKRAAAAAAPKPAAAPVPKPKPAATPASASAPTGAPPVEPASETAKTPEPAAAAPETKPAPEAKPSGEPSASDPVPN